MALELNGDTGVSLIQNGVVVLANLAPNSVDSSKIVDSSILPTDLSVGAPTWTVAGALTVPTEVTSPKLTGGSSTTQALIYKTTTGVGGVGADHVFQTGNNGATEAMRIRNNGIITTPMLPVLRAVPTTNYSSGGMPTGVVAMTAQINNGNHFSGATSRFTAPVAGFYRTTWGGLILASTVLSLMINGIRVTSPDGVHYAGTAPNYLTATMTLIVQLAANDYLQIEGWNGGGYHSTWCTWNVDLIG